MEYKKIGSYIPQLTVIVIIVSIMKQLAYYYAFNLPIKYFLGISELGLLIADDLVLTVPMMIIYTLLIVTLTRLRYKKHKRAIAIASQQKKNNLIIWKSIFFSLMFICAMLYVIHLQKGERTFYNNLIFCGFFISTFSIIGYIIFEEKLDFVLAKSINAQLVYIFALAMALEFIRTGVEIRDVKKGAYNGTVITINNIPDTSNPSHYFIGKTATFVFIHNSKYASNTIIPIEKIDKIELKKK